MSKMQRIEIYLDDTFTKKIIIYANKSVEYNLKKLAKQGYIIPLEGNTPFRQLILDKYGIKIELADIPMIESIVLSFDNEKFRGNIKIFYDNNKGIDYNTFLLINKTIYKKDITPERLKDLLINRKEHYTLTHFSNLQAMFLNKNSEDFSIELIYKSIYI